MTNQLQRLKVWQDTTKILANDGRLGDKRHKSQLGFLVFSVDSGKSFSKFIWAGRSSHNDLNLSLRYSIKVNCSDYDVVIVADFGHGFCDKLDITDKPHWWGEQKQKQKTHHTKHNINGCGCGTNDVNTIFVNFRFGIAVSSSFILPTSSFLTPCPTSHRSPRPAAAKWPGWGRAIAARFFCSLRSWGTPPLDWKKFVSFSAGK